VTFVGQDTSSGLSGSKASRDHSRQASSYEILSGLPCDELARYGLDLLGRVRTKWYPGIPQWNDLENVERGTAVVDLSIKRSGAPRDVKLHQSSGSKVLDDIAWNGVKDAAPYPPLPATCKDKWIEIRFYFEYNRELSDQRPACAEIASGVYRVGGPVQAPRGLYLPDPEYSEEARKSKRQGIAVLSLTVGVDGQTTDLCIRDAAGSGLDEQALKAVKLWKFEPATKDGLPVPVRISVETAFNLY